MPSEQPTPAGFSAVPMEAHTQISDRPHRPQGRMATILRSAIERPGRLLRLWRTRIRESDELNQLSDRELRDFGVNRYEVEHATRKAFWRG